MQTKFTLMFFVLLIVLSSSTYCLHTKSFLKAQSNTQVSTLTGNHLGLAKSFVVLAFDSITNNEVTEVNGKVGVCPGLTLTFGAGAKINNLMVTTVGEKEFHLGDDAANRAARTDLVNAFELLNIAQKDLPAFKLTGNIGKKTLTKGVYNFASTAEIAIGEVLTLDGGSNDVWIFQIGSSITTLKNSKVLLVNGAKSDNVYWIISAAATLGEGSLMQGNVMAKAAVTLGVDAKVKGRLYSLDAAISLVGNVVNPLLNLV
jgi:hypothetical protein